MSTNPHKDIKTLSFRITRALWIRIGDAARRLGISNQALCTEAIERHLTKIEKKNSDGDVNGPSVRRLVSDIRKKPQGE